VVWLAEDQDQNLTATIAHEFGHACTRDIDLDRRGTIPNEEWRSELTADWYAYKWGFGREIVRDRKIRDWHHHGPKPGDEFTVNDQGKEPYTARITRRFVGRIID